MKLLFVVLLFISFSVSAQSDEWVEFKNLPDTIKKQTDSLSFKNALHLWEGGYLVECGTKRKSVDTSFSESGTLVNTSSEYRRGASPIGTVLFTGVAIYFFLMLAGLAN